MFRRRLMEGLDNIPDDVIMTIVSNPEVLAVCYEQGWCASKYYMTLSEAQAVTDIGTVFRNNKSITHFEELRYFGITELKTYSFSGANKLEVIDYPDSLTTIGEYSFSNAAKLKTFQIKSNVSSCGVYAFGNSNSMITITIDSNVLTIGRLNYRTGVKYESNIYNVVNGCVYDNTNHILKAVEPLSVFYSFPQGITSIDSYAFYNNRQVDGLTIPSTITSIGSYAFWNSNFANITISEGVSTISTYAFYGSKILSIVFPASVTTIGSYSLSNCTNLQSIHTNSSVSPNTLGTGYYNTQLTSDVYTVVNNNTLINGTILFAVAKGVTGTYTIPNGIETIGSYCFHDCKASEIIFPSSVVTLESNCFLRCNAETITLGSGVGRIKYQALCLLSNLKTLNISASVTTIDSWGIYGLNNLETLTVDVNNTSFDSRDNCNAIIQTGTNMMIYGSLNTVIPNTVVSLRMGAFRGLNITTMDVPASVTNIQSTVFNQCSKLKTLTFRATTPPTIGSNSIENTSTLTDIYVPAESVNAYKTAQYWSNLASKISAIS